MGLQIGMDAFETQRSMEKDRGGGPSYRDNMSIESLLGKSPLLHYVDSQHSSSEHISEALPIVAFLKQVTNAKAFPIVFH